MSVLTEWMLVNPSIIEKMDSLRKKYNLSDFNSLLTFLMNQPVPKNIFGNVVVRRKLSGTMVKLLIALMDYEKLDAGSIMNLKERKEMADHVGWSYGTMQKALKILVNDGLISMGHIRGGDYQVMDDIKPTTLMKYGGTYQ